MTKIPNMSKFVYDARLGFIQKHVMGLCLLLTLLFSFFSFTAYINTNAAELTDIVLSEPILHKSKQDKISEYIRTVNPKLDLSTSNTLSYEISQESEKNQIPVSLILGLIKAESNFDQFAVSSAGALGFWQILPRWHLNKISKLDNRNLFDPVSNSEIGAAVLRDCMDRYKKLEASLSCYNGSQKDRTYAYAKKVMRNIPKNFNV